LGTVEFYAEPVIGHSRNAEAALLEPPVVEDETTVVPGEHIDSIPSPADESKEVARKHIFLPLAADDRRQSIDALAQIDRRGCQQDAD